MRWELDAFADSLTSVTPSTVAVYRRDIVALADWAAERDIDTPAGLNRRHLRGYLSWLIAEGYARRTLARKASSMRRYFAWAVRRGLVDADPSVGLQAPSGDGRLPRVLRNDELEIILDEPRPAIADDEEHRRLRDDAVLELLYGSGLRVSEVCGLAEGDIDRSLALVRVLGKGNKERLVPLSEPSLRALDAWIERGRGQLATAESGAALFLNLAGRRSVSVGD